ncbi:MAG TPA: pitrilysin family protein, partial [Thermoanaerobaculia bacterium]|nr:pitrilysin family protein [Thermoanaerobaculia bacterium]
MNPRPALRLPSLLGLAGLALARLLSAQVERVDELRFPVLPPLAIPTVERHALANGMVVLFAPDHELGLVSATLMLPTGTASEPAEKVGLVRLGAELLRTGGAGERSADELDELLDAHGAEIATEADPDSLTVELSCLAPDFPQMLGVLADLLRRPRFAPDRLEIARGQLEAEIARQNDDPGQITGRELDEILYGEASPYARQATYATLGAIRREDLLAWQAQQLHPNGLVMGLSGDFDPAQALKLLEIAFGGWPKGPAQPRRRIDQFPAPKP